MGARHGYCSNPNCERSWGARHGQELPVRDRPTQPDCIIIGSAPIAPAAASAHSDTDVSHSAPVFPSPQVAELAGPAAASAAPAAAGVGLVIDWAAVRLMNEQGYQRWLDLQQPAAPAGPAPGTPEIGAGAAACAPIPKAGRVPTTPPDRPALAKGADRPAVPKGPDPVPSGGWLGEIPQVDIVTSDDEAAAEVPAPAPAAPAAASSDLGPAAPAADAAAFAGLTRQ